MKKLLAILLLVPAFVFADPITYEYVGDEFDYSLQGGSGSVPSGISRITATFVAETAANLTAFGDPSLVSSWAISDGLTTILSTDGTHRLNNFVVWTDASGLITSMLFSVAWFPFNTTDNPIPLGQNYIMNFDTGPERTGSISGQSFYCTSSTASGRCRTGASISALRSADESLTAVPEPATLALLGLGMAGIGLARRRKVRAGF